MGLILVVNAGSSSLKFALLDPDTGERAAEGIVERIGESSGAASYQGTGDKQKLEQPIPDHAAALA